MDKIFQELNIPVEDVCKFLAVFSRLEYALKTTGFVIGNSNRVDPAWDKFANEINEDLLSIKNPDLKEAINYFFENPPRKQILENNHIKFIAFTIDNNQKKTQQLLLMVRVVRNNLFHGGKYLPDGEIESGRNKLLVSYSLKILLNCIPVNKNVFTSYES